MKIKIKTKITKFLRIRYQQTSIKCNRLALLLLCNVHYPYQGLFCYSSRLFCSFFTICFTFSLVEVVEGISGSHETTWFVPGDSRADSLMR